MSIPPVIGSPNEIINVSRPAYPSSYYSFKESLSDEYNPEEAIFERASEAYSRVTGVSTAAGVRNLFLHTQSLTNADVWDKTAPVVVTQDSSVAPDGTQTAATVNFGAVNRALTQTYDVEPADKTFTFSIWVKGTVGESISTGVYGSTSANQLHTLTGEWQRLTHTRVLPGTETGTVVSGILHTYAGATAMQVYAWGAQLEEGTEATEYQRNDESIGGNIPRYEPGPGFNFLPTAVAAMEIGQLINSGTSAVAHADPEFTHCALVTATTGSGSGLFTGTLFPVVPGETLVYSFFYKGLQWTTTRIRCLLNFIIDGSPQGIATVYGDLAVEKQRIYVVVTVPPGVTEARAHFYMSAPSAGDQWIVGDPKVERAFLKDLTTEAFIPSPWTPSGEGICGGVLVEEEGAVNPIPHINGRLATCNPLGTTPPTVVLRTDVVAPFGSEAWEVQIPADSDTDYVGCRASSSVEGSWQVLREGQPCTHTLWIKPISGDINAINAYVPNSGNAHMLPTDEWCNGFQKWKGVGDLANTNTIAGLFVSIYNLDATAKTFQVAAAQEEYLTYDTSWHLVVREPEFLRMEVQDILNEQAGTISLWSKLPTEGYRPFVLLSSEEAVEFPSLLGGHEMEIHTSDSEGSVTAAGSGDNNPITGLWQHFVLRWNTTEVELLVDQEVVAVIENPNLSSLTSDLFFGSWVDGTHQINNPVAGIRIYRRWITDSEINDLYLGSDV